MGELTCDDCGTINQDSRSTCELCGESLSEEEQRREERKHRWLAPIAWIGGGIFLFAIFFAQNVWWQATRKDIRHDNRASGLDLLEVLTEPTGALIIAGIMTASVVGFGIYQKMGD